jgi:hypothetical protein
MTKIFWSWQSDRPGKTGRHFVKGALQEAIKAVLVDGDLEESKRDLHLDHDREGLSGSPDLAAAIFEKIRASTIFVADVTPIGIGEEKTEDGEHKRLMNPNVAIELGYALSHVGNQGLLMVMNKEYGGRDTLPFDLSHKAGPIFYKLAAGASKAQIESEKKKLIGELKTALRACLAVAKPETPEFEGLTALQHRSSSFIGSGEVLCRPKKYLGEPEGQIIWTDGPQLFLRVIPRTPGNFKNTELQQMVTAGDLKPFPNHSHRLTAPNKWGVVVYNAINEERQERADLITQATPQGEIWGIDAHSIKEGKITAHFENYFEQALYQYLTFYQNYFRLGLPVTIIAGMTGIADMELVRPAQPGRITLQAIAPSPPRFLQPEVIWKTKLRDLAGSGTIRKILLPFFETVWDAAGESRPHWLPKE